MSTTWHGPGRSQPDVDAPAASSHPGADAPGSTVWPGTGGRRQLDVDAPQSTVWGHDATRSSQPGLD